MMMNKGLITRNTDYAIRAVSYMAEKRDRLTSVSELVKALRMPRPFLRKILQALRKKGILESYKGSGGGFALAVKPEEIFVTDLMTAFQGEARLTECVFRKKACPNIRSCVLRKKLNTIEENVLRDLKSINIASLVKGGGERCPGGR